jgi:hypothetical protein
MLELPDPQSDPSTRYSFESAPDVEQPAASRPCSSLSDPPSTTTNRSDVDQPAASPPAADASACAAVDVEQPADSRPPASLPSDPPARDSLGRWSTTTNGPYVEQPAASRSLGPLPCLPSSPWRGAADRPSDPPDTTTTTNGPDVDQPAASPPAADVLAAGDEPTNPTTSADAAHCCSFWRCAALCYVALSVSVIVVEVAFAYPALLGDERAVSDRWMRFDTSPTGIASVSECEEHCTDHLRERSSSILFKAAVACGTTIADRTVAPLLTSSARAFRPMVDPYVLRGLTVGNYNRARNVTVLLCSSDADGVDAAALQAHAWRLLQRADLPAVLYRPLANRDKTGALGGPAYEFTADESGGWSEANPSCPESTAIFLIFLSILWAAVVAALAVYFVAGLAVELGVRALFCCTGSTRVSALAEHEPLRDMSASDEPHVYFLAELPTLLYLRAERGSAERLVEGEQGLSAERVVKREQGLSFLVNALILAILTSCVQLFVWWMGRPAGTSPFVTRYAIPSIVLLLTYFVALILELSRLLFGQLTQLLRVHNGFALFLIALCAFSWALLLTWFLSSIPMAPEHAERIALTFAGFLGYVYVGYAGWHQYSHDASELVELGLQIERASSKVLSLLGNHLREQVKRIDAMAESLRRLRKHTVLFGGFAALAVAVITTFGIAISQPLWGTNSSWLDGFSLFLAVSTRVVTRAQLKERQKALGEAFSVEQREPPEPDQRQLPERLPTEMIGFGPAAGAADGEAALAAGTNDKRLVELCNDAYTGSLEQRVPGYMYNVVGEQSFRAVV